MLILNSNSDAEKQLGLADCAENQNIQDIYKVFVEWRTKNYGMKDGAKMFRRLQNEVDLYTEKNQAEGGKALLQWYEGSDSCDESGKSDDEVLTKAKRKKRKTSQKPLILAIVTPLMARAHQYIQQGSEIVFYDSTASLD